MDKKNILIIKEDNNDFEKFYNDHIIECGVDVATPDQFRLRTGNKLKKIINLIKSFFVFNGNVDLKKYNLIIIFEDAKIIPIVYRHKKRTAKIILWNWNIKTNVQANEEKRYEKLCEIWTFDKNDAQKYKWRLNSQFYFNLKLSPVIKGENKSAFLACVDKGRYQIAKEIRNVLTGMGIECNFWLVKQKNNKYEKDDEEWIKNSSLSYSVFLKNVQNSDIIIDLVQKGQSGITVRILEAIIAGKKIITNNVSIRGNELFDKKNMYIWEDKSDMADLYQFLNDNKCEYDVSVVEKYMFDSWIENFY